MKNQENVDLGDLSVKKGYFELIDHTLIIKNKELAEAVDKLLKEAANKEATAADRTVNIKADVAW